MKKGLALSAFLAVHNIVGAMPATAQNAALNEAHNAEASQGTSIRDYCDRQFTLIGDTNHDDLDVQNTLYSQKTLGDLISCNVTKVFIEKDANSITGALVDLVAQGKIEPRELVEATYGVDDDPTIYTETDALREQYLIETQFIYNAAKAGIEVIPFDNQAEAIRLRRDADSLKQSALDIWTPHLSEEDRYAVQERFSGSKDERIREQANLALMGLQEREPDTFMAGWNLFLESGKKHDAVMALRDDDSFLKREIDEHMSDGGKAAIILGNGHFENKNGLQTLLGREKTRWIVVGDFNQSDSYHVPDAVINPQAGPTPTPRSRPTAPAMSIDRRP